MWRTGVLVSLLLIGAAIRVGAQYDYSYPAPPPAPGAVLFSGTQLDQMAAPIALYPDPLVAQILPAATQPAQVAVAANYLASGGDPNLIDQQGWDSSIKAVAHYPDVLRMMADNLQWTTELGQAFLNQPVDVMNAIQRLRAQALQLGNLQNTPQQSVVNDNGEIEILPANPQVIYVPQYDPGIIYYQSAPALITFGLGFGLGAWLDHDFDWHRHRVIAWDRGHPRPEGWWRERPEIRHREIVSHAPVWRPEEHRPARRQFIAPMNRGDRGYEPRPARVEPTPRRVEPRPARIEPPATHIAPPAIHVTPPAVHIEPPRTRTVPVPAPPRVLPTPSRPPASAFTGVQSAHEARAASSRGETSRQSISRPAGGGEPRRH